MTRLRCCVCSWDANRENYHAGERDVDGNWICPTCLAEEKEDAA